MSEENQTLKCPECSSDFIHNYEVLCGTGQDGDPPYYSTSIRNVRNDAGKSTLSVTLGNRPLGSFRVRELDAVLNFWCEMCHASFFISYLFHKGQVYRSVVIEGKIDIEKV